MSNLNVKVGDKGTYENGTKCEVVFVKNNNAYFVTSSLPFVPMVHATDGTNHNEAFDSSQQFRFIPEPKTVDVYVWANRDGSTYAVRNGGPCPAHAVKVTLEIPR